MRRILIFSATMLLSIAILFTGRHVSAASSPAALEQELKASDLDFARQTAARGLDGWMDFFADDASTISSGRVISGKAALRDYYKEVFADKTFTLTWKPTRAEAAKDGTLGYTYGDYEAREGASVSHGMYVTEWRRIHGKWKVVLDLGSAAPAAKPTGN